MRCFWYLPIAASLLGAAGCSDGPHEPRFGSLAVAISGLPAGATAAVDVTGPEGFAHVLHDSETLPTLVPGAYTIAATAVNVGDAGYAPTRDVQTINVPAGGTPASASVDYVLAIGELTVAVSGLPAGVAADIDVSGPGIRRHLGGGEKLTKLAPGSYTITAGSVTANEVLYNPSPGSRTIRLDVATPASISVTYAASTAGNFNLTIGGMYVVQSAQARDGAVPLLERRDGLLRIFGVANRPNTTAPPVRVRLYQDGALIGTTTVNAAAGPVPTDVDEGSLDASWNLVIPAGQLRRGLAVLADIDPDNVVAEGNERDNVFPRSGTPMALDVRPAPLLRVRFVPVYQSANDRLGQVNDANRDQFLAATLRIHPVVDVASDVRATYTTSVRALDQDDDVWAQVLSEINALRVADGDAAGRHYYGVVRTTYASGIAGLGYVAGRSAVGWDFLPSAASVVAHELGHNWGRYHAPCGDVTRPDTRYPYPGGVTGVYGFDFATNTIRPPSSTDVMGYCASQWISDYTYRGILDYRETDPTVQTAASAASATNGVLVWGRIVNGELLLEPAFEVAAPPSLPARSGPYAVDGLAADGSTVFSLSFTPEEVADASGQQQFAFVVPLSSARASRLATFRLTGQRRVATVSAAAPAGVRFRVGAAPGEATLRRAGNGRVALRWDAAAHPMVMVRDPSTGRILAFARGGSARIVSGAGAELDLVASDRIHSQRVRARVAP